MTAVEVYRRHAQKLPDHRLAAMIHQAVVYSLRRIWHHEVTTGMHIVELETRTLTALPELFFIDSFVQEARMHLQGIERKMFDLFCEPDPDDITLNCCYSLFQVNQSKPVQTSEMLYLATYFNRPRREIQSMFYRMRDKVHSLMEKV